MNSTLTRSIPAAVPWSGRILAIEPDASRAAALRRALRQDLDVRIAPSCEHAIWSIREEVPDLVMTSTFLQPSEVVALGEHVRQSPGASHLQIIDVPYFIDSTDDGEAEARPRSVLRFLRGRRSHIRPRCDQTTLRDTVEQYLAQAMARRSRPVEGVTDGNTAPTFVPPREWDVAEPQTSLARSAPLDSLRTRLDNREDRRRARRRRGSDVATLWGVRLPWGDQARVVDISTSGVLLESAVKITPGSTVDLQLLGRGTNLCVPSRMVRAEVADVDPLGVKYRIAATFSKDLDLVGLDRALSPAATPRALVDLLARVVSEPEPSRGVPLRQRFETELRGLFEVADIQLRERPVIVEPGRESIYFTVPEGGGAPAILQVIFGVNSSPSAAEFRLLRTAATLSRAVLELEALAR